MLPATVRSKFHLEASTSDCDTASSVSEADSTAEEKRKPEKSEPYEPNRCWIRTEDAVGQVREKPNRTVAMLAHTNTSSQC